MPVITLTTDFGTKDYAVARVKASILNKNLHVQIVDISHEIAPFDILEASFILNAVYRDFPDGSIHIMGVDAEQNQHQQHLLVQLENHFFLAADNGFFSLLNPVHSFQKIIKIQHPLSANSIFPVKDVFIDVAMNLLQGMKLEKLGEAIDSCSVWKRNKPNITLAHELLGHIVYVDRFGNLITDISKEMFMAFVNEKSFEISISSVKLQKVYQKYDDFMSREIAQKAPIAKMGKALAVFNSLDLLEIALYKSQPNHGGSASKLLGMKVGDSLKIQLL